MEDTPLEKVSGLMALLGEHRREDEKVIDDAVEIILLVKKHCAAVSPEKKRMLKKAEKMMKDAEALKMQALKMDDDDNAPDSFDKE